MKPREAKLSHEELIRLLDYDPATGVFRWKVAPSNRVHVGQSAGSPYRRGYIFVTINGVRYAAHRLAWFYVYKFWPKNEIDHINLVSGDNRITNLREATHQQNVRNVAMQGRNRTGFKGVTPHQQSPHKFIAQITVDGRNLYLGLFDTPEDAHAEYVKASIQHHQQFGRST